MSTIFIEMYSIEYNFFIFVILKKCFVNSFFKMKPHRLISPVNFAACWVNQILGALYRLVCIIRPVTPFIGSDHGTIGQMINDD